MTRKLNDADAYVLAILSVVLSALSFFGVALWWVTVPDDMKQFDAIGWSLAILQTFLVIVAFGGFWMVRGAARAAAVEEAKSEARRIAKDVADKIARQTALDVATAISHQQRGGGRRARRSEASEQEMRDALDADE